MRAKMHRTKHLPSILGQIQPVVVCAFVHVNAIMICPTRTSETLRSGWGTMLWHTTQSMNRSNM